MQDWLPLVVIYWCDSLLSLSSIFLQLILHYKMALSLSSKHQFEWSYYVPYALNTCHLLTWISLSNKVVLPWLKNLRLLLLGMNLSTEVIHSVLVASFKVAYVPEKLLGLWMIEALLILLILIWLHRFARKNTCTDS